MIRTPLRILCLAACFNLTLPGAGGAESKWVLQPGTNSAMLVAPSGRDVYGYLQTKPAGSALTANSACGLFPLLTPSGESVVALAPKDHPHHRGVFLAWYEMIGREKADFWGWGAHAPTKDRRIVNTDVKLVESHAGEAKVQVENEWRIADTVMMRERLTVKSRVVPEGNWHELTFTLMPTEDVRLPKAAFGGFCVKGVVGTNAVITTPRGAATLPPPRHDDPKTGWPDEAWYDYSVQLPTGKTAGVTVLSHPGNPPTRWHNPIGIGMINPCILMGGDRVLMADRPLVLRYALLVHDGPCPTAGLEKLATQFRSLGSGGRSSGR